MTTGDRRLKTNNVPPRILFPRGGVNGSAGAKWLRRNWGYARLRFASRKAKLLSKLVEVIEVIDVVFCVLGNKAPPRFRETALGFWGLTNGARMWTYSGFLRRSPQITPHPPLQEEGCHQIAHIVDGAFTVHREGGLWQVVPCGPPTTGDDHRKKPLFPPEM